MIQGQSLTCNVTGGYFTCGTVSLTETFDLSSLGLGPIDLGMEVGLTGSLADSDNMDLDLDLHLATCSGDSCSLLSSFGIALPCTIDIEGSASVQ